MIITTRLCFSTEASINCHLPLESNILGSWLYETDKHGYPIAGNVLFVGTKYTGMGIDFCGISEDAAESLKKEFEEQIAKGKA